MKIKDFIDYEQPNKYIVESERYSSEYDIPVLTAGQSFILGYTNESIGVYEKYPCIIFDDFTTSVHYVDFSFKVKSSAMKILKNKENADLKYCYYLLLNMSKMPPNHKRQWISTTSEKEHKLPSINDQRKITNVLDKISNIINFYNLELKKLDELIKARFVEMFGDIHNSKLYPYANIDSITTVLSGGTPDRKVKEYWDNGTIRWVKTTELQNCVITDTEERITQAGMDNSSAKIVPIGSILIAMYGQGKTRGMTGYLAVECTTNQACACILPTKKINQIFLWKYLILSYDKLRNMAKGGNQPNLNIGIIKKFPILVPPIELQEQFADFVRQVDKSKFEVQKSLEKTQQLYDSLMQKYFG